MSDLPVPARERWNERYSADGFQAFGAAPAEWLVQHAELLSAVRSEAASARALDVACGDGRNAAYLAELGFAVDAIDVSDVAIEALRAAAAGDGLPIVARVVDLEREALPAGPYAAIICMNYLQRELFAPLVGALAPGGVLLCETFARAHVEELGRSLNPAYVLDRNELLRAFGDLHVRDYREGVVERRGVSRGVASIVAQRLSANAPRGGG